MPLYNSIDDLIGNTPLVRLSRLEKKLGLSSKLYAKLEYFNPAGSSKDRVAKSMLDEAESLGKINKNSVIIEPTSGNTGIGLAAVAVPRGYRVIIVMPETMSEERKKLMRAYGAELVLTDGALGMSGSIEKAKSLAEEIPGGIVMGQFENFANPLAHYNTTGREIYNDLGGALDAFVAGVGTGGTVSGVGKYLKEQNSKIKIVAVEPHDSAILSGGKAGAHGLQGIGAGFIPEVLNTEIYDEIITSTTEEAYAAARLLASCEGYLVGISSGAALHAAIKLAERPLMSEKNIAVLLPDTGARYLSTSLFD